MGRILVGVDGSKESRDAVKFASELAKALGGQLTIASAIAPVIAIEGAPELLASASAAASKERAAAKIMVKDLAALVPAGIPVETMVVDGAPVVALSDLAVSGDVEMVVVGHRGRNAVARALLGSVADRLVQICPKPVLVVR